MKNTIHILIRASVLCTAIWCSCPSALLAQTNAMTISDDGSIDILNFGKNPFVPKGAIIMWSGSIGDIPEGWALCDGDSGTPDLSGRFIEGYDPSNIHDYITRTGGNDFLDEDDMPAHSHTGTTNKDGKHIHYWQGYHNRCWCASGATRSREEDTGDDTDAVTKNDGEHTHSFTTDESGGGTYMDNRPEYMVLAYIMKL